MKRHASLEQPAANHDGSGAKIFLLVNAQLVNLGTVKSGRNEGIHQISGSMTLLCLCNASGGYGERQKAQQCQNNTGGSYKQPNQNAQIKEGGLRSALVHRQKPPASSGEQTSFTRSTSKMSTLGLAF